MDLSNKKIIVGGWPAFAEQAGVNKKEPIENFDWVPSESDKLAYEDFRAALDSIEGSREWLKKYTKSSNVYSFDDEIGAKVSKAVKVDHSGASFYSTLWCYKNALNDWDTFVLNTKVFKALAEFKRQQVPLWKVKEIVSYCNEWMSHQTGGMEDKDLKAKILSDCAKLCLTGMNIPEILESLLEIQVDLEDVEIKQERKRIEEKHKDLMSSIQFLYEHPIRWFDTPSGCTLSPCHPTYITERAMSEMETKTPGYKKHIENVLIAMGSRRKPSYDSHGIFSVKGNEMWNAFLKEHKVIA